jgi:hypothetical protein
MKNNGSYFGAPAGCNDSVLRPGNRVSIHTVIAGLDPAIHRSSQKAFREEDGCAGQARA